MSINNNINMNNIENMNESELMELAKIAYIRARKFFGKMVDGDGNAAFNCAEYLQDIYKSFDNAVRECVSEWYMGTMRLIEKRNAETEQEKRYCSIAAMCNAIRKQARFELNHGTVYGKTEDYRTEIEKLYEALGCEVDSGLLEEDAKETLWKAFENIGGFKGTLIISEKLSEPEVSVIELSRRLHMSEKTIAAIIRQAKDEYYRLISM